MMLAALGDSANAQCPFYMQEVGERGGMPQLDANGMIEYSFPTPVCKTTVSSIFGAPGIAIAGREAAFFNGPALIVSLIFWGALGWFALSGGGGKHAR